MPASDAKLSRREAQLLVDRAVAAAAVQKHQKPAVDLSAAAAASSAAPAAMPGVTKKLNFRKEKKKQGKKSLTPTSKKGAKTKKDVIEKGKMAAGEGQKSRGPQLQRHAQLAKAKKAKGAKKSATAAPKAGKRATDRVDKKTSVKAEKVVATRAGAAVETKRAKKQTTSTSAGREGAAIAGTATTASAMMDDQAIIQSVIRGRHAGLDRTARDQMLLQASSGSAAALADDTHLASSPTQSLKLAGTQSSGRRVASGGNATSSGGGSVFASATDAAGLPVSCPFLNSYLEEKIMNAPIVDEASLLQDAHTYFTNLTKKERHWNRTAMNRLRDMKRVNRQGGDKDGFQYVVPKHAKTVVQQLMMQEGVEGASVDGEKLESTFLGDGMRETESKPMRRKKIKNYAFDDFYQFQVAKKWTKNAESFLSRGRANRNMFMAKQQTKRTIKKM